MKKRKIIAVIDIGAGRGAKTALFDLQGNCLLKGFCRSVHTEDRER